MYHPECKKDEIFVGNTRTDAPLHPINRIRKGEQAFDIYGKRIHPDYMRPLFIGAECEQQYDNYMMSKNNS